MLECSGKSACAVVAYVLHDRAAVTAVGGNKVKPRPAEHAVAKLQSERVNMSSTD
ncbi:hypothetical protein CC80DRAFT_544820 [Byssothecium circinans]|uniref:Uncharacterized protein n=1 Tax=Byssothecium circinans TaxID=147558 RepID=A0A6A5U6Q5_9PLEO|nr:hypothetical protein CC80DRAFT_544820 [Byssothecium circinans]